MKLTLKMKREIKFRAWDIETNKMIINFFIRTFGNKDDLILIPDKNVHDKVFDISYSESRLKVMQYTELKDKNEKEIYEEDIIKDCISNNKFIVTFGEYKLKPFSKNDLQLKHLGWYLKPISNYDKKHNIEWNGEILSLAELTNIEVIGNVYENKELLK